MCEHEDLKFIPRLSFTTTKVHGSRAEAIQYRPRH
jgi:hypothetical protein